jgi:hypothetical protein
MAGSVVRERTSADAPTLAVGGKFKKFGPEEEKACRKADVDKNETISRLMEALLKYFEREYSPYVKWKNIAQSMYRDACRLIDGMSYSAEDIGFFCVALTPIQEHPLFEKRVGFLLSALMNNCKEDSFELPTRHLSQNIDHLGFQNIKNIVINGDLGNHSAELMKRGSITVNGSVGYWFGERMKGGKIVVTSDAGSFIGSCMDGGHIIIHGNAGDSGHGMAGGIIEIKRDAKNVGFAMSGGIIIIRGNANGYVGSDSPKEIAIHQREFLSRPPPQPLINPIFFCDVMESGGSLNELFSVERYPQPKHYMEGGVIHIYGEIANMGTIRGGRIYHKGELIVDK